jgi:hypothetical protein
MSTNDPEFHQAPKFSPEQYEAPPRQRGCFFYGCIIASVLAVLMLILLGIAIYVGYRFLAQQIDQYTSTSPIELPKLEMPAEQRQAVKERFESFKKAVDDGTPIEPLVLTSDDLNALISENEDLKGTIYVTVDGDEVKGKVSWPLDKLGIGMVRGRYLNGEADLKASLQNGVLIVTLDSIEVNGKKPPEEFLQSLRQQNLAKDMYKDEKNAAMIRKFESLEIKDGKITIKVRAKPGDSKAAPDAKKDAKEIPIKVVPSPAEPKNGTPALETPKPKVELQPSTGGEPAPKP